MSGQSPETSPTAPNDKPDSATGTTYFKSGRKKTITLIVAGVLAIGALGGISALVFGDDSKDARPATSGASGVGDGEVLDIPEGAQNRLPGDKTGPTPSPNLVPEAANREGKDVTIGDGIEIPVPESWQVTASNEGRVWLSNGRGSAVEAIAGTTQSTDALALVAQAQEVVFDTSYTKVKVSEPESLTPVGSTVSTAIFNYGSTLTDLQSSFPVLGAVVIAIRQDGAVLILNFAHTPPKEWADSLESFGPVVDGALNRFAGL